MNARAKSFFGYMLPATGSLFVTYLYNVIDGIFVGRGAGAAALGAVNIAVPFITFVVAAAAMFPMGGAAVTAVRMGRGDTDGANRAFMTAFSLTVFLSLILMITGMVFSRQITDLSGARTLSAEMRAMSADYLFYYSAFSVPMLISTCLSVFVRNDGSPTLSFAGMCAGAMANIFLDWLFIFPLGMGVIGAAVASGLGQIFSMLILLSHFIRQAGSLRIRLYRADLSLIRKICRRGVPEAVTQLATPVTALCYNLALADLMGDTGISTFSILSFIHSLTGAVLSGVAQGLQPLWGNSYGRQDTEEIRWYLRCGMVTSSILAVCLYGILLLFGRPIICIFNRDADLVRTAAAALPLFSLSLFPMGINLTATAFFFSTKRTEAAGIIAVSRGVVVKAAAVFAMPLLFGVNAIWIAPFAAELITLILAVAIRRAAPLIYQ